LIDFLDYFEDISNDDDVPNNSILREFIGKSCFF
jgi:uridine kinase